MLFWSKVRFTNFLGDMYYSLTWNVDNNKTLGGLLPFSLYVFEHSWTVTFHRHFTVQSQKCRIWCSM